MYLSMPCRSVLGGSGPGGSPIFRGALVPRGLQFFGGLQFFKGVSNFLGGLRGDPHNFFWGGNFFLISAFFGDTPPSQDQPPEHGQRSAGTHPTGMHSCLTICTHSNGPLVLIISTP